MQLLPVICIYFKSRPLNPSLQKSLIIFLLPIKTATPKSCLKPSKPSSKIMPAKRKNQVKESSSSNESSSYEVESILEKRIKNGKEQYKVVWRGYPIEEATWQPRSNMNNCSQMIVEFQLGLLTKKDKQEMFQALLQTEDEIQDQVLNTPYNIYETNINAVLSSSVIQQCKRMGLFLDNAVTAYKSLPEHSQIQEVVQAQDLSDQNQPSYFLVKVKGNSCLFKIQRDLLLSDQRGRMKIIDYYESLVYSK